MRDWFGWRKSTTKQPDQQDADVVYCQTCGLYKAADEACVALRGEDCPHMPLLGTPGTLDTPGTPGTPGTSGPPDTSAPPASLVEPGAGLGLAAFQWSQISEDAPTVAFEAGESTYPVPAAPVQHPTERLPSSPALIPTRLVEGGVGVAYTANGRPPAGQQPSATNPVVGWLVCTEGPSRGQDYRLLMQNNTIGRVQAHIIIPEDTFISRNHHAMISYDPDENTFVLVPGQERGITRLNGKAIYEATVLSVGDHIKLGHTMLTFIPFCTETFQWNKPVSSSAPEQTEEEQQGTLF